MFRGAIFFFADDIREEIGDSFSLIGVHRNLLTIPQYPYFIPKTVVYGVVLYSDPDDLFDVSIDLVQGEKRQTIVRFPLPDRTEPGPKRMRETDHAHPLLRLGGQLSTVSETQISPLSIESLSRLEVVFHHEEVGVPCEGLWIGTEEDLIQKRIK